MLGGARDASAAVVQLTDGNSILDIDTSSASGVHNFYIDGVDHLFAHWFYYRVGNVGPESPVSNLFQTNIANTANVLSVEYSDSLASPTFRVTLTFTLNGGGPGSGAGDLIEDITIQNLTNLPLDFHFFQYADFDLNNTTTDSVVAAVGSPVNTVTQTEGSQAIQELVTNSNVAPISHHQVDFYDNIVAMLSDGDADDLNDNSGPLGPGDLIWALQWDFTLDAMDRFEISKDIRLQAIPEPSMLPLFGLAVAAGLRRRR
jgi:hypothetical protein